jgi:hypothetical protein
MEDTIVLDTTDPTIAPGRRRAMNGTTVTKAAKNKISMMLVSSTLLIV